MGILTRTVKRGALVGFLFVVFLYLYRLIFWWWTTRQLRSLAPVSRLDLLYPAPMLFYYLVFALLLAVVGGFVGYLLQRFSH